MYWLHYVMFLFLMEGVVCCCCVFSCDLVVMFIKAITLDGFKSYAQRTEISNFDPLFNAVTGLNGSGKSNILDGICFVLGITNLSQVSLVCYCCTYYTILRKRYAPSVI